jgi:hypothetical protein
MRLRLLLGTSLLLALSGCGDSCAPQPGAMIRDDASPQAIAARMGLALPPEARVEHAEGCRGKMPQRAWW